jgi:iron complex outermembrane receptor protein
MVSKMWCGLACLLGQLAHAAVSESDYLADVPTVISVSRLSQTLDDTPGAVTILDRQFIRMSGARSVVEVLRFVPGFQTTTSFESDAPMATYHGRNDDWANRIQVLVDGRSVYSSQLQGSAGIGWQTLGIDDIERIEVLRGSNSASYGARAFLGVVNIVSRDVRETLGAAASLTQGANGIADGGASVGWSALDASFRLSADRAGDDGLQGAFGKNHTERLNFSSHFALEQGAELDLRAGALGIYAGRGEAGNLEGNPQRPWSIESRFVQADWRRSLSETQDLSLSASHAESSDRDRYLFQSHLVLNNVDYIGAVVDASGQEYVDTLTLQHTLRLSPTLRSVWGGEFRREKVVSPPLLDTLGSVSTDFYRLFGSAEWRITDSLLLNAGALAEHSDADGASFSPRLMFNWHAAPGHTLRAGTSTAFRPPGAFERLGQVQFLDANGQNPTGYFTYNDGTLQPEKLLSQELGYYLAPPGSRFSGDVRLFNERITDGIGHTENNIPVTSPLHNLNGQSNEISGIELQLNWEPDPATRVFLSQNWTHNHVSTSIEAAPDFRTAHGAPRYSASLALMHRFDAGWQLSLMHQVADDVALMSISGNPWLFSMQRTDVRLARDFILGGKKAELGVVVQNLGDPYQDGDRKYLFKQRAMLTFKIEN